MATWTKIEGNLEDGEPLGMFVAEQDGQIWKAALCDHEHPLSEDEFVGRLDGRGWRQSEEYTGSSLLEAAIMQIRDYFAGNQLTFDLPLALRGTPFQLRVWEELQRIPFGKTCSYGEIAERLERSGGMRAVGGANGKNRFPLIIPCHRVVAAGGRLGGYTGGIGLKARLLAHEVAVMRRRQSA